MSSPQITHAEVSRIDDVLLEIQWTVEPGGQPVSILVGDHPDAGADGKRLIAADVRESRFQLNDQAFARRPYFSLQAGEAMGLTVAERVVPLQGAQNFRDLGGYQTRSGQRIKWGVLFRSDYLSHLSEEDCRTLRDIGIRTVFDLRGNIERERNPSRWHPQSRVETVCWEDVRDVEKLGQRLEEFRRQNGLDRNDDLSGFLSLHYRRYVEMQASKYSDILKRLTSVESPPALIHCTAGKDRTGIMVALLLHLLGVEEKVIMEDYLLTNACIGGPDKEERFRLLLEQFGIDRMNNGAFNAMRMAQAEYLDAAFRGMREDYGSVEEYLDRRLGIDKATVAVLRSVYLE